MSDARSKAYADYLYWFQLAGEATDGLQRTRLLARATSAYYAYTKTA